MQTVSPSARWGAAAMILWAMIFAPNADAQSLKAAPQLEYIHRLRSRVPHWRAELPALQSSGSQSARGVLAGGHLYFTGPQQSFIWEGIGRAGGLMLAQVYDAAMTLHPEDTVLAASDGSPDTNASLPALFQKATAAHAHVVLFSNGWRAKAGNLTHAESLTAFPTRPFQEERNRKLIGLESISNVIGLWAWTGAFISGCVAGGRMPTIYESIWIPGGRARDAALQSVRFHSVSDVTPQAARGLSAVWLDAVEKGLEQLAAKDQSEFLRAAALLREGHAAGKGVQIASESHMFPVELTGQQAPAWLHAVGLPEALKTEDTLLMLGYQEFPWALATRVGPCILTCVHRPPAEFTHGPGHVYINPYWQFEDNAVELPGYEIKLFPISGVMQGAILWQLVELTEN